MCIITNDGRTLLGILHGFDQLQNVILTNSCERIYSMDQDVAVVELGLYLLRGDNIAIVGEVDDILDDAQDLTTIRANPIGPVVHTSY